MSIKFLFLCKLFVSLIQSPRSLSINSFGHCIVVRLFFFLRLLLHYSLSIAALFGVILFAWVPQVSAECQSMNFIENFLLNDFLAHPNKHFAFLFNQLVIKSNQSLNHSLFYIKTNKQKATPLSFCCFMMFFSLHV